MDEGVLLFELHGPDGHIWKIHSNGFSDGFPDGTIMVNYAMPFINVLISMLLPGSGVADEQIKAMVLTELRAQSKQRDDPWYRDDMSDEEFENCLAPNAVILAFLKKLCGVVNRGQRCF